MRRFLLLATALEIFSGLNAQAQAPQTPKCLNVKHAGGETCVPKQVKRLVVLDTGELDAALALGFKPVGAAQRTADGFPTYLKSRLDSVQSVGLVNEPSLEKIAALKPDLILANGTRHAKIYAQLARLAPTVMNADTGANWKNDLRFYGQALGRSGRAGTLLTEHLNTVKRLHVRLGPQRSRLSFSMVQFHPSITRIMLRDSFIGSVFDDLGLKRPAIQQKAGFFLPLSLEQINLLDADYLFYAPMGAQTQWPTFQASPLWSKLRAVQGGRVHAVDPEHWIYGFGLLAVQRIVQDIEKTLP